MRASTLLLVAAACLCVIIGVDAVAPGAHKLHKSQSARAHQPIHVLPPDLPPGAELLFTRPNRVFPSSAAAHVEPVLNYRVRHEDNQHLHTVENLHPASQHPLKIANAVNSIGAHSLKMRWRDGLKQPFPNSIFVGFRAFDQDFLFHNLQLDTKLYAKDAKMELHGENGEVTFLPMSHNTYITSVQVESREGVDSAGWAVCTIGEDGLLTATINMGQETYQVNPLYIHANEFEEEHYNALKSHAVHNLVITRHSDMTHLKTGGHQCGAAKPRTQQRDPTNTTQTDELTEDDITWAAQESTNLSINLSAGSPEEQEIEIEEEEPLLVSSARRRLMAYPPGYGITRYTNCYSGDTTAHKMSIGITVDVGYYEIYASAQNVANSISNMLASVNGVYVAQFNIFLELQGTIIKSASDGTSWNLKPDAPGGRCSSTAIDVLLNSVTSFRSGTNPKTNSLWHHLTACYPAPGTVGLAWVGTLCHSSYSTGVSSWTGSLWLTVAHEIGHNTGANHAFQEGQGTTGGIMDYGDGIYPLNSGIYQFNPKYAQTDQCALFAKTVTVPGFSPYCWASYAPVCGNGVVEPGEQCDDPSSCCSGCRFTGVCTQAFGNTACCNAQCQYTSTTTMCNNNLGFCGNGVCLDAVCQKYGLPLCGIETTGCKVKCGGGTSGQACTSGWTAPDCNIASGLVCKNSPYSTCNGAGACTTAAQPVTYSWVAGGFGSCSCAGTQTRSVSCQTNAGGAASDASCTGAKPATSQACTAPSSCYQWQQSGFGGCSVNCGTGTQTQTVQCVQSASGVSPGAQAADTFCTGAKPATQQGCTPGACPTAWVVGAYSSCTVSCGGGVQTRSVVCQQTQNGLQSSVGDQYCTQPKPATQSECNTVSCQDGHWTYSSFTACSKPCAGGTQTRTHTCTDASGAAIDSSRCVPDTQPLSQACNTQTCPDYVWSPGSFGACSVTCGGGTQTRPVYCYDLNDGNTPHTAQNTNFCTLTEPSSIQGCNTQACPIPPNYQWSTGSYGQCMSGATVVSCGGSTTNPPAAATRTVTCINTVDSSPQPDPSCSNAGAKPATSQPCAQQGCPTYSWASSGFTSCTVSCGGGTQTQQVVCKQDGTSNQVADTYCTGTKPATSQTCNTAACLTPHQWQAGPPSACSAECNGGTQTYSPQCYRTDTTPPSVVDPSVCSDTPKPATSSVCNTQMCPTLWVSGAFGTCSQPCGPSGVSTRTVGCFYSTDNPNTATPQPDSACTTSKPATQASCNSNPCPTWQYIPGQDWSACSAACNIGIQTRNITCVNFDGTAADPAACASAVPPEVSRTCQILPCPHWHRGLYSSCSKPCADYIGPGSQSRTVVCRMPHDDPNYFGVIASDDGLCPKAGEGDTGDGDGQPGVANGKPPLTQSCNLDACPAYYWLQSNPGTCSKECGGGVRASTVVCISAKTGQPASSSNLCLDEQPTSSFPCNEFECPVYAWVNTTWSDCSAGCGSGTQTRRVSCRNFKPDPSIHFAFIDVEDALCQATGAKPPTSQVCTLPEETCWGDEYQSGGLKNGRCEQTTKTCTCRSGYSGAYCTDNLGIANVKTNSDIFGTAGVPFGESLSITWESSTTLFPHVNILLTRTSDANIWPIGQYLATMVPNINSWSWSVGSVLQSGLEAGGGYQIRVWFSKNNGYGDSAAFAVADPCGYISCGSHGTCSRGICKCSEGYSGQFCGQGPCERALCDTVQNDCSNDALIASGQYLKPQVCPCSAGFTGAQCRTPFLCASTKCLNGGDLGSVVQTAETCTGKCVCRGNWIGAACETCGLTCQNGGVVNAACTSCDSCKPGYFGKDCSCQYYLLGFKFLVDVSGWFDASANSVAQARWSRTLALDIITAVASVSPNKAAVSIESITPQPPAEGETKGSVLVSVKLSLSCAPTSQMGGGADDDGGVYHFDYSSYEPVSGLHYSAEAFDSFLARHLLSVLPDDQSLLATYNSFRPLLGDTDSPAYQGQITSQADPKFRVTASDPSGAAVLQAPDQPRDCFQEDCTAEPDSGGDDDLVSKLTSSPLFIALISVGLLLLLGGGIFGIWWCVKRRRSQKDTLSALSRMGNNGESEMTANPALTGGRWQQV